MNEMYTTFRVDTDNNVMPTIVVRQKPFTTPHFVPPSGFPTTKFLELPRWKISANLLLDLETSKNDAARYNFVQVFTRALADVAAEDMAQQIQLENFVFDNDDIKRQGLRPYVVTANFDFPLKERNKRIRANEWAKIVSDWIIDGHLKESGKLKFVGLQDPISVGDNIEFDNIVYHIEAVQHTMVVAHTGKKSFRTSLTVSYGIDKRSSKSGPVYANMTHTDAHTNNIEDFDHERILPGVGDTQDLPSRVQGEEVKETRQASFTPRRLRKSRRKTSESNTGADSSHGTDDGGKSKGKK